MLLLLLLLFIVGASLAFALAVALIQVLWKPCETLGSLIADWLIDKFTGKQD